MYSVKSKSLILFGAIAFFPIANLDELVIMFSTAMSWGLKSFWFILTTADSIGKHYLLYEEYEAIGYG